MWNRLHADCIGASSVNIFKTCTSEGRGVHLDKYAGLSISQRDSLSTCHLELIL